MTKTTRVRKVVGGCQLHGARTKLPLHEGVGDDGQTAWGVGEGVQRLTTNQMGVPGVLGVNGYAGVTEHCL